MARCFHWRMKLARIEHAAYVLTNEAQSVSHVLNVISSISGVFVVRLEERDKKILSAVLCVYLL